jgi:DNA invertase Pin-like site-specific DNA recombinase
VTDPAKIAQYDAVVALKFDRLSRGDDASTAAIEAWARDNGKLLITVSDALQYPCEGIAGIRWDLAARMAHQEWLEISERYTRMGDTLRAGGFHVGRAPFGYVPVIKPGEKHKGLVIVPAEADIIRDAAEWYLGGLSLDDVCAKLNGTDRLPRAMKSGHQPLWAPSTLSKVLHNEVIAGRQRALDGRTILRVDPILSREIWEKVIARMSAKSKCKGRTGISQSKTPAMLTSVIMCTACDKPMYRITGNAYYCRIKGCKSRILIDVADQWVSSAMLGDDRRDVIEVVIPGSGHEADIAEVKRDLAEAVEAEEFDRIPSLRDELARLRALPAERTRVERRESDRTVGQMWAAMADDSERRAYLMERGARVLYGRDENGAGWLTMALGQPQSL